SCAGGRSRRYSVSVRRRPLRGIQQHIKQGKQSAEHLAYGWVGRGLEAVDGRQGGCKSGLFARWALGVLPGRGQRRPADEGIDRWREIGTNLGRACSWVRYLTRLE